MESNPEPFLPDEETLCSNCGHFVGAALRCVHCGAPVQKRLSLRVLRWVAVLLATLGVVLLYLYAVRQRVPLVRIGNIGPLMNFAQVRLSGELVSTPYCSRSGDQVRFAVFNLADGDDEVAVFMNAAAVREAQAVGTLPAKGDRVEVQGVLNVKADGTCTLRLQSATGLRRLDRGGVAKPLSLEPAFDTACLSLREISAAPPGETVMVQGRVKEVRMPPEGSRAPVRVVLEQDGVRLPLVYWKDTVRKLAPPGPCPGAVWQAEVRPEWYRGELQLRVTDAGKLRELEAPSGGTRVPVEEGVATAQVGERVTVEGTVLEVSSPLLGSKAPYRLRLRTGQGQEVAMVYWQAVATVLGRDAPVEADRLRVTGTVTLYRDALQLEVLDAVDIVPLDSSAP